MRGLGSPIEFYEHSICQSFELSISFDRVVSVAIILDLANRNEISIARSVPYAVEGIEFYPVRNGWRRSVQCRRL